ncbi:cell division protein DIVIC [Lachnoanaerobaculum umeaense]|uniref:Cell division protein DIVIC n=2 Tax=Lachnoanaerobaculum umeaense TaxID=617123 RepID=A0A385Q3D6_9FIRM|nr:cell division protein DIVIC [Lachnoanaerobaculum umeaense]
MKRFLAIVILLILVISLIGTIYVAIFTSNIRLLFVFLFIDIVIPVVIYAYLIITKHIRNLNKRDDDK